MTYLCKIGYTDGVITEDSDLLVYSAVIEKSYPILTKFGDNGNIKVYKLNDILKLNILNDNIPNNHFKNYKEISCKMFVQSCILSGCDYLKSIHKIGPVKAFDIINKYKDYPDDNRIKSVLTMLKYNKYIIPDSYEDDFNKAINDFYTHKVYNPFTKKIVELYNDKVICDNLIIDTNIPINKTNIINSHPISKPIFNMFNPQPKKIETNKYTTPIKDKSKINSPLLERKKEHIKIDLFKTPIKNLNLKQSTIKFKSQSNKNEIIDIDNFNESNDSPSDVRSISFPLKTKIRRETFSSPSEILLSILNNI